MPQILPKMCIQISSLVESRAFKSGPTHQLIHPSIHFPSFPKPFHHIINFIIKRIIDGVRLV